MSHAYMRAAEFYMHVRPRSSQIRYEIQNKQLRTISLEIFEVIRQPPNEIKRKLRNVTNLYRIIIIIINLLITNLRAAVMIRPPWLTCTERDIGLQTALHYY